MVSPEKSSQQPAIEKLMPAMIEKELNSWKWDAVAVCCIYGDDRSVKLVKNINRIKTNKKMNCDVLPGGLAAYEKILFCKVDPSVIDVGYSHHNGQENPLMKRSQEKASDLRIFLSELNGARVLLLITISESEMRSMHGCAASLSAYIGEIARECKAVFCPYDELKNRWSIR